MKLPSEYFAETDSDKTDYFHRYGDMYDLIFNSLLHLNAEPIRVLEIGVTRFGEGSGHAFCEMPYVEQFVGVDKSPLTKDLNGNGIFIKADAYVEPILDQLKQHAPFHLMIDDGLHQPYSWNYFLEHYRQFLATPGVMVVEDVYDRERIAEKHKVTFMKHASAGRGGQIACVFNFKE